MPLRKIKITEKPNATGLSMANRVLAIEVLQSLEKSVSRVRVKETSEKWRFNRSNRDWTLQDEQDMRTRVYRSAIRQLQGAQATQGEYFHLESEVPDEDMQYVLESLGRIVSG